MDLENRNAALTEELSSAPRRGGASQADWVPRAPAAYTLTGHRAQVRNLFLILFISGFCWVWAERCESLGVGRGRDGAGRSFGVLLGWGTYMGRKALGNILCPTIQSLSSLLSYGHVCH